MDLDITFNNAWVDSYLEALLSTGLSAEHIGRADGAGPRFAALDEEQATIASFYVHQILSLDEERIRDAWLKASRCARTGAAAERDSRINYLSWRVWGMKRRQAEVQAVLAAEAREGADEVGGEDEEEGMEDEVDATTVRTIDDLNSTAMAEFEGLRAGGGAFGSVALDALTTCSEPAIDQQVPVPSADPDQSWIGVKEYSTAPPTTGPPGLAPSLSHKASQSEPRLSSSAQYNVPSGPLSLPTMPGGAGRTGSFTSQGRRNGELAVRVGSSVAPTIGGSTLVSPFASVPPSPALKASRHPPASPFQQHGPLLSPTQSYTGAQQAPTTPTTQAPDPLLVSRFPGLYIILISLHGLVRGEKMELGKDPDTGGQVKYVVELAKALGQFPSVARVDLLTRLINDPKVDASYGQPEERLVLPPLPPGAAAVAAAAAASTYTNEAPSAAEAQGDSPASPQSLNSPNSTNAGTNARGAFIVRLPCGPSHTYLRKEDLWPHVREFADRAIAHASSTLARLQEGGPCELYIVHGHYADAGEAAGLVASTLGVDCVLTGHSLGRNKREHLLKSGTISPAEVEATYRLSRRIEAEERALDCAAVVFTSTQQEVAQQWGTYDGYSDELSAALQLRPCKGYHVPRMAVIPPGLDFSNLKVSMPVDPWEEILGAGPAPALPTTPIAATPEPSLPTTAGNAPVFSPPTPTQNDLAPAPADAVHAEAAPASGEEAGSVAASGHSGSTGARRSREAANSEGVQRVISHGDRTGSNAGAAGHAERTVSAAGTPTRQSWHGGPSTPSHGNQAHNLGTITPSRMAALMAGESEPQMWREINRFLRHPGRPVILAMCRPDAKKNLQGLVRAYGNSRLLRELTNLVLIMGNRDKIDVMAPGSTRVLTDVLKLIDTYDLYGCVAYPKKHTQADISDIYLLATATKGVFVNVALQEPFGLTLIEAAAHGVPIVATTHGGPVDIVSTLKNGVLVEPTDTRAIAEACTTLITAPRRWEEASDNGRRHITAYSWPSHCARYLRTVQDQKSTMAGCNRLAALFNANPVPTDAQSKGPASSVKVRHTLSLSFDDLGSLARAIAASNTSASAAVIKDAVAVVAAAAAAGGAAAGGTAAAAASGAADAPQPATPRFTGEDRLSQQLGQQAEPAKEPAKEPEEGDLAQTSAPSTLSALRSTFSTPLSNVKMSALGNSRRGVLNIPTPDDVAAAIEEVSRTHAAAAPPETTTDAVARGSGGAMPATQETAAAGTPVAAPVAQAGPSGAAGKLAGSAAVAAAAKEAADMQAWGGSRAVQQVLAAAIDVLEKETEVSQQAAREGVAAAGHPGAALSSQLQPCESIKSTVSARGQELQPRMNFHERFVVFNFDSVVDVASCAPAIKALLHGPAQAPAQVAACARLLAGLPAECGGVEGAQHGWEGYAHQIGVGVMCAWGTKDLKALLNNEGIDPLLLDFMVCNAGALIWHSTCPQGPPEGLAPAALASPTSQPQPLDALPARAEAGNSLSSTGNLLCDDEWEHHVDWRWDDRVVKQVLGRILDNKSGWGRLTVIKAGATGVPRKGKAAAIIAAATQTEGTAGSAAAIPGNAVAVDLSPASSPLHYMLDVEVLPARPGARGAMGTSEIARQLLNAIRRKLRMSGLRAQLMVTPCEPLPHSSGSGSDGAPTGRSAGGALSALLTSIAATITRATGVASFPSASAGDPLRSFTIHITPLRCSRALALRHLAARSRRPLASRWTIAACTAASATTPGATSVRLPTATSASGSVVSLPTAPSLSGGVIPALLCGSDGEDLVAGVQRVVLLSPNKQVPGTSGELAAGEGQLAAVPVAFPVDVAAYGPAVVAEGEIDGLSSPGATPGAAAEPGNRVVVLASQPKLG